MRISVVMFLVGVIMLIGGIVLAIMAPATATWEPKSESLIDKVITVDYYEDYDYWFASKPFIYEEAKDFVINGTATEQSSPQLGFNFYVFDSVNFDLWKADASYTAYYEAEDETSINFNFSIATKDAVPDTFYFVVEDELVRVTATISWVEKATIAAAVGGLILGGIIAFLGFIVMIIAGIAALVFKPKAPTPPTPPT